MKLKIRTILFILVAALIAAGSAYSFRKTRPKFQGQIMGASYKSGHLLREGKFPDPSSTSHAQVVIVGGGIAGLSAAWKLQKSGFHDFLILELESQLGGNSQGGENEISAYPWGAHYVTLPSPEATYARELFQELGIITGYAKNGLPIYNETYLCSDPEERLYISGRWQDGLLPQTGISARDREEYLQFFKAMDGFRAAKGADGKKAFCIPLAFSSQDPKFIAYDRMSMAGFMDQHHWNSPFLRWYVNYCCRDDYGTTMDKVSAWAGIHYFAAHNGHGANAVENAVLTWPEGNAWLAKRLAEKVGASSKTGSLVYNVEQKGDRCFVDYLDLSSQKSERVVCSAVIFAAPRFVAGHVIRELREKPPAYLRSFSYAPWMVANVSVDEIPKSEGVPPAWDNVFYDSPSLGYVVATHQKIERYPSSKTVLTYYWPLSDKEPQVARQEALGRSYKEWADLAVNDLNRAHPGIEDKIHHLDVWIWGHGMIRPLPGFIWGEDRKKAARPLGSIYFANSDMSGISIFEEAQYQGVEAAKRLMRHLGSPKENP